MSSDCGLSFVRLKHGALHNYGKQRICRLYPNLPLGTAQGARKKKECGIHGFTEIAEEQKAEMVYKIPSGVPCMLAIL